MSNQTLHEIAKTTESVASTLSVISSNMDSLKSIGTTKEYLDHPFCTMHLKLHNPEDLTDYHYVKLNAGLSDEYRKMLSTKIKDYIKKCLQELEEELTSNIHNAAKELPCH